MTVMNTAIQAFLNYLRIERNASDLTVKSYADDMSHVSEFFLEQTGSLPEPRHVEVGILRSYVSYLHECGYARTTVARRLACLRSFFRYCNREGICEINPAKPLRTPRAGRKLPHFLTTEQVSSLLTAPPANSTAGLRDRAILETVYSAGLRVSELVGLDVSDWDRSAGILRVLGKGRKERLSPVGSYATKALDRWMEVRQPDLKAAEKQRSAIFLNRFGRRLTTRSIGRLLETHIQTAGLSQQTAAG